MGQHRGGNPDRPMREAVRLAAGHTQAAWDYLVGDLPKGSQTRRDIAWVAGFVLTMMVLIVFSVLMLGDWTASGPNPSPAVRETVTVDIPASEVGGWCTSLGCWPPDAPQLRIPLGR